MSGPRSYSRRQETAEEVFQICRQTQHHWPRDLSLTRKIPILAFDTRFTKEISPHVEKIFFLIIIGYINNAHLDSWIFLEVTRRFAETKIEYMLPSKLPLPTGKVTGFTQFFSLALLLVDHNLLSILLGWVGIAQMFLNLEFLPIPSRVNSLSSTKSSSSASFILRVEDLDFGDLKPETLQLSSPCILVVVLKVAVCFDGSIPCVVSNALILLGKSVTLPPAAAALACSKKRTWTTTLRGSSSFCAACMQASTDSFLQSRIRHSLFLSLLLSSG